jgi:Conserved hypothetical protein 2217 (DUF2460)
MSTPIFPFLTTAPQPFPLRGIEWSIEVTPDFATEIQTSVSRLETRASYDPYAHYTVKFAINILRDLMDAVRNGARTYPATELGEMWDFLSARKGSFEPFFFPVKWDQRVENQVIYPLSLAGVKDYQVIRPYKTSGTNEPVGGIVAPGVDDFVYVDSGGGPVPVAFTYNVPFDGWVRLTDVPPTGSEISVTLSYYWKVRFLKDNGLTFRTFGKDVWEVRTVEFYTVRP